MNVVSFLDRLLARHPEQIALVTGCGRRRRRLSYLELADRVDRTVERLTGAGLKPGDGVLLAVPLSIETYVAIVALLKAGLVIQYLEPSQDRRTIERCLAEHPPAATISAGWLMRLFCGVWPSLRRIKRHVRVAPPRTVSESAAGHNSGRTLACSDDTPALLTFTSGSTGLPKGIVRTHGFLREQLASLNKVLVSHTDNVNLSTMPMFVLCNLANGVTSVLPAGRIAPPARTDCRVLARQLADESVTQMIAPPALLEHLVRHLRSRGEQLFKLERVYTGGGPVPPMLPQRIRDVAPAARVTIVYGSSEAEPVAWIADSCIHDTDYERMLSGGGLLVGAPADGCDVRVVTTRPGEPVADCTEESFDDLCAGPGCAGEIVVHGSHVLDSYANARDNALRKITVAGRRWHRTGDCGYIDETGRLWLLGRSNAVVDGRSGRVHPFEVEIPAAALPNVKRAALTRRNGQSILMIEPAPGRDFREQAVCNLVRGRIDFVQVVRELPLDRRHNSKIDYTALPQPAPENLIAVAGDTAGA